MSLSARARANLVGVAAAVPYALSLYLDGGPPTRPRMYLALAWGLGVSVLCQWVYHRYSPRVPASALPAPELSLTADRVPRVAWMAIIPPVIAGAILCGVLAYGSELPWRDTWLGPQLPASSHGFLYRHMVITLIGWNCLFMWLVLFNLAKWHGLSRAYTDRRAGLVSAVAAQWLVLVMTISQASGMSMRLPPVLATTCGIVYGATLAGVMWIGCESERRRRRAAQPPTGTWIYFDLQDPSFFGPRGLNAGNAWSWVLGAAALAPLLLGEWMLHLARS
ncbi:MAG: hypothetical protein M3Y79_02355 [Pseudomonadota bacterium]|nr:hypothetical protein [Pseudomonadota bacterium]